MIGKVPPDQLRSKILTQTGADDDRVLMGPQYGEDTAAIDLGEQILVLNTDPLSLAADQVGTLGVHVVCNDVAASGAEPAWLTNCLFLHDDDPAILEAIIEQVDAAARAVGVAVVGGHAEYTPTLDRPMLALSALGVTDRYVPSGGADPGDRIILTAGAGIEGTAILATDFRDELEGSVDGDVLDRAATFIEEISVVDAAMAIRDVATGMHDPTEGGVLAGLVEMAVAAELTFEIDRAAVPIRAETRTLCEAMGVDPLAIFGSGALLATVPADRAEAACDAIRQTGTQAAIIGSVAAGAGQLQVNGTAVETGPRDELYELWAE